MPPTRSCPRRGALGSLGVQIPVVVLGGVGQAPIGQYCRLTFDRSFHRRAPLPASKRQPRAGRIHYIGFLAWRQLGATLPSGAGDQPGLDHPNIHTHTVTPPKSSLEGKPACFWCLARQVDERQRCRVPGLLSEMTIAPISVSLSLSDFAVTPASVVLCLSLSLSPPSRSCRRCWSSLSLSPRLGALHRRGVPDIRSIGCRFSSPCGGGRARKWWVASAGLG